jgi:hypothetical protein
MNVYQFKCVVWVRGETPEEALKELHDEVDYHFSQDNNLLALESDEGELCEEESEMNLKEMIVMYLGAAALLICLWFMIAVFFVVFG